MPPAWCSKVREQRQTTDWIINTSVLRCHAPIVSL
jgi:hypothetical protein